MFATLQLKEVNGKSDNKFRYDEIWIELGFDLGIIQINSIQNIVIKINVFFSKFNCTFYVWYFVRFDSWCRI